MKREMMMLILGIFMISLVAANTATITVMDDIGSFSGAILKIKSTGSSEFGTDKTYPSEYFSNVGIVKFEIETALSELDLQIKMIKDGSYVDEIIKENVGINGSEIMIDLREKVEIKVISEIAEEALNETENITIEVEVNETEEIIEEGATEKSLMETTGNVVSDAKSSIGKNKLYYSIGGGFLIILLALFFVVKMAYRSGARDELKLLAKTSLDRRIDNLDI